MEFAAIDFETTGYEGGNANEPWQLGIAVVRDGAIAETREFFFDMSATRSGRFPARSRRGFPSSRDAGSSRTTSPANGRS